MSIVIAAKISGGALARALLLLGFPTAAGLLLLPAACPGRRPGHLSVPTVVITAQHLKRGKLCAYDTARAPRPKFCFQGHRVAAGRQQCAPTGLLQYRMRPRTRSVSAYSWRLHKVLQYRLNGVILPDGISVFRQHLPPRDPVLKLITGSLPAEYGLRSPASSTDHQERRTPTGR